MKGRQIDILGNDIVKPVFFMDLEKINSKPCYFCDGYGTYRDGTTEDSKGKTRRKLARSEEEEPGVYMQHETLYSENFGPIKIFECSKCHHMIIFRSSYHETGDL